MSNRLSFERNIDGTTLTFEEPLAKRKTELLTLATDEFLENDRELVEMDMLADNLEFIIGTIERTTMLDRDTIESIEWETLFELFYYAASAFAGQEPDLTYEQSQMEQTELFDGAMLVVEDGTVKL